jgi:hypothetical protein
MMCRRWRRAVGACRLLRLGWMRWGARFINDGVVGAQFVLDSDRHFRILEFFK